MNKKTKRLIAAILAIALALAMVLPLVLTAGAI